MTAHPGPTSRKEAELFRDFRTVPGTLVLVDGESDFDEDVPLAPISLRDNMIRHALSESPPVAVRYRGEW